MMVTEVGSEVDVGMIQNKEANKGGTFKDKFKHSGKTTQTPTQVWTDKYRLLLKSNGWGGAGKKCVRIQRTHNPKEGSRRIYKTHGE